MILDVYEPQNDKLPERVMLDSKTEMLQMW